MIKHIQELTFYETKFCHACFFHLFRVCFISFDASYSSYLFIVLFICIIWSVTFIYLSSYWPHHEAWRILVPQKGIETCPFRGSTESLPLDCQGSPTVLFKWALHLPWIIYSSIILYLLYDYNRVIFHFNYLELF